MKIHKTVRTDEIGHDCGWSMWECEVEMDDGTIRHGFVQGDEHSTAEETLEDEFGEPFNDTTEDGPTDAQLERQAEQVYRQREIDELRAQREEREIREAGRGHLLA